ncbi:MAG: DUF4173 domain-containing protein [bacterium]|nr:DUF4173 domain-containing protein [bacterium]
MSRPVFIGITMLIALIVGVIGDLLFNLTPSTRLGINAPLYVLTLVLSVFIAARIAKVRVNRRNLWIVVPLLFFAFMLAIRTDASLSLLNMLAVIALGGFGLVYLFAPYAIDDEPISQMVGSVLDGTFGSAFMPLSVGIEFGTHTVSGAINAGREGKLPRQVIAIGRGALIAVPILAVFGVLFIAADAVFQSYVERVANWFDQDTFWALGQHGIVIAVFGWAACGAIAYGVLRRIGAPAAPAEAEHKPKRVPFTLGIIEAAVILGSVVALFGLFVVIQFAYFFGGTAALELSGLTYAEYARRGFFELVAVSLLTLALVLWLDWVTVRGTPQQKWVFRGAATALVGLTGVILLSAANRMYLYEEAWGFTHLRVYVHIFIYWIGVLFGFFLLSLYRVRGEKRVFALGVLLTLIGYAGTLNLINVDLYIAERNIERYENGEVLDVGYLYTLSADAAPAMIDLFMSLGETPAEKDAALHQALGQWLRRQYDGVRQDFQAGANPLAWHYGRGMAYAALSRIDRYIPPYDRDFYMSSSRSAYDFVR